LKKFIAIAAATLSIIGLVSIGTAKPAAAGAYGCAAWGAGTYAGKPYAQGGYCAEINGSGTFVKYVGGGFNSAGNVCNWNITAEFFDSNGRWYQTYNGPAHYQCNVKANDVIWINQYKARGRMCSTLKSNGGRIQSVCHNIY
jgi:hypothetical protein